MEKSFDLGSVLRQHQKKHKSKPTHFESVAGGVHRRMENSLKQRKSSRLTSFDCARNLPQPSPLPETEAKQKADSRKKQLQKWKDEREKKKKEQAAKKIKPFITGVPHNSLKYVPPPPVRAVPSSSGRVTRSQSAKLKKEDPKKALSQSFAPSNARFHAPQIKTLTKMPKLDSIKKKKDVAKYSFQPVVSASTSTISTRSRAKEYQRVVESRVKTGKTEEIKPKGRIVKPVSKPYLKSKVLQSSSSSENASYMQTSGSSSDVDLTARIISSSEDSTRSPTDDSAKSLQSSSSCESVPEKQAPLSKRKSLNTSSSKAVTPLRSSQKSTKDKSKLYTPRNSVPKSESSSEERLRSPKSPVDVPMTPEQIADEFKNISPCVTMSRGKDNARKEMKKKIEAGLLDEDASDMESVEYFQRQLSSEIKRMTEICQVWDKIYEQVSLPESVQGLVLGAVGQARLLMSQKMQQFSTLVQRCARPEPGATLVTPADLRGFWDMVFLQVENLDMRFKELEELKARDWVEKAAPAPAVGRVKRPARPAPPRAAAGATSRIRDMIAAARKAKSQEAAKAASPQAEERTFEAGFFSVRSPARSPRAPAAPRTPATPRDRNTLLKAVLSSEAEKASASKKSASFAMLRASVLGKSVECEGVAPLPPSPLAEINFQITPGRSILKQSKENLNNSNIKQIKVVLFDQSDSEMDTSSTDLKKQDAESKNTADNLDLQIAEIDINASSVVSPMDEKEATQFETKKNNKRNSRLSRQDAVTTETAPVMTRRMQKYEETLQTEQKTPLLEQKSLNSEKKTRRRSTRKKLQPEAETIQTLQTEQEIPVTEPKSPLTEKKTARRSLRKKVPAEEVPTPQTEQKEPEKDQKTPHSEKKTPRRSIRKKVLAEVEHEQITQTEQEVPLEQTTPILEKKTPKRSTRKKVLTEMESNAQKENVTPMRSTRRKKTEMMEV